MKTGRRGNFLPRRGNFLPRLGNFFPRLPVECVYRTLVFLRGAQTSLPDTHLSKPAMGRCRQWAATAGARCCNGGMPCRTVQAWREVAQPTAERAGAVRCPAPSAVGTEKARHTAAYRACGVGHRGRLSRRSPCRFRLRRASCPWRTGSWRAGSYPSTRNRRRGRGSAS